MTYSRLPDEDPSVSATLDRLFRKENFMKFDVSDRMRCQACKHFYWRLWYDRAQCLGCRFYSRIELGEFDDPEQLDLLEGETEAGVRKTPNDLRRVAWVRLALEKTDSDRVHCISCGRSEYIIFADHLKCRWCKHTIVLKPMIAGFYLLEHLSSLSRNISSSKEAVKFVGRSAIYQMIKKKENEQDQKNKKK